MFPIKALSYWTKEPNQSKSVRVNEMLGGREHRWKKRGATWGKRDEQKKERDEQRKKKKHDKENQIDVKYSCHKCIQLN